MVGARGSPSASGRRQARRGWSRRGVSEACRGVLVDERLRSTGKDADRPYALPPGERGYARSGTHSWTAHRTCSWSPPGILERCEGLARSGDREVACRRLVVAPPLRRFHALGRCLRRTPECVRRLGAEPTQRDHRHLPHRRPGYRRHVGACRPAWLAPRAVGRPSSQSRHCGGTAGVRQWSTVSRNRRSPTRGAEPGCAALRRSLRQAGRAVDDRGRSFRVTVAAPVSQRRVGAPPDLIGLARGSH